MPPSTLTCTFPSELVKDVLPGLPGGGGGDGGAEGGDPAVELGMLAGASVAFMPGPCCPPGCWEPARSPAPDGTPCRHSNTREAWAAACVSQGKIDSTNCASEALSEPYSVYAIVCLRPLVLMPAQLPA